MAAAILSLIGVFVALYLYLWQLGIVGTPGCGTGGCETVPLSSYSRFQGLEAPLIGLGGYLSLLLSLAAPILTGTFLSAVLGRRAAPAASGRLLAV